MFVAFVSDICHVRLRYLSRSFQISISCELDITKNYNLYDSVLQCLKDVSLDDNYNILYSAQYKFVYCYNLLNSNILLKISSYRSVTLHNSLLFNLAELRYSHCNGNNEKVLLFHIRAARLLYLLEPFQNNSSVFFDQNNITQTMALQSMLSFLQDKYPECRVQDRCWQRQT